MVVWARVPDRNGVVKDDPRPLLVIQPLPIAPQGSLCCLAISTDPKDDPADPAIEMPWDAETGSTTGLYEWCRVVLLWRVYVDQTAVDPDEEGFVEAAFLIRVRDERQRALDFGPPR